MNDNLPLVSIVIPAFNLAGYLGEAIESVLAQDYPNLELIVLDDGSTDATPDVLRRYGGRIRAESQPNMGQVNTMTKGWAMSRGEILSFLSADDGLLPGAVSAAVACLKANPGAVLAYCDFNLIGPDSAVIRRVRAPDYDYDAMLVDVVCPPGPGAFFLRSAYEAVGPWDNTLKVMLDYDYWLRLGLQGRFVHIPRVLALYRVHGTSQTVAGYDEAKANEPVLIVERMFERADLPPRLLARRDEALGNAHLVAAQLHLRAGRYRSGLDALRRSFSLWPANLITLRALRVAANVLFNRVGHQVWWRIRRVLGAAE